MHCFSSLAARNSAASPPESNELPDTHSEGSLTPDDVSSVVSTPSDGAPPAKRRRKPDGKVFLCFWNDAWSLHISTLHRGLRASDSSLSLLFRIRFKAKWQFSRQAVVVPSRPFPGKLLNPSPRFGTLLISVLCVFRFLLPFPVRRAMYRVRFPRGDESREFCSIHRPFSFGVRGFGCDRGSTNLIVMPGQFPLFPT